MLDEEAGRASDKKGREANGTEHKALVAKTDDWLKYEPRNMPFLGCGWHAGDTSQDAKKDRHEDPEDRPETTESDDGHAQDIEITERHRVIPLLEKVEKGYMKLSRFQLGVKPQQIQKITMITD